MFTFDPSALAQTPQPAPSPGPAAVILRTLFTAPSIEPLFASSFTAQVPAATIRTIVDGYRRRLGAFVSIEPSASDFAVVFDHGSVVATVVLDAPGKITGLLFHDEMSLALRKAIERFLAAKTVTADWFSASFLAQVPAFQIQSLTDQIRAQEGSYLRLDQRDHRYIAVFEKAENPILGSLDDAGRFVALRILPPVTRTSGLPDALQKLAAPSGESSYLIVADGADVASLNADRPMAVGSAFKLAVLSALRSQIDAKRHAWSDVVSLTEHDKSLPSGTYQDWPSGTPVTLATYATQMISISDNTATDVLARVVGRDALEELSPRNVPFLTTRELFALKSLDHHVRGAYLHGDIATRRAILATIAGQPQPNIANLELSPSDLDIEWFFTNRELCALMSRVADLDLMTVNPGVPRQPWKRVAFKGGSDAGVLNLTADVTAASGKSYCVVATWNDRSNAIDEASRVSAFSAVLNELARL